MYEQFTSVDRNVSQEVKMKRLNKYEREESLEWLEAGLQEISKRVNEEAGLEFTDDSCRVSMSAYSNLYSSRERKDDRKAVMMGRMNSTGIVNTEIYQKAHAEGRTNPSQNNELATELDRLERYDMTSDGQLAEAVATVVLHKAIGDKFLVVRTSKYDDYENGIDTIIVDKETGEMVCAFDEVVNRDSAVDDGAKRYQAKIQRSKEALKKRGGMKVKYGVSYAKHEDAMTMELTQREQVPTFCLSLERSELYDLIRNMDHGVNHMNEAESIFFERLIDKLEAQEQEFRESGFSVEADHLGHFCNSLRQ